MFLRLELCVHTNIYLSIHLYNISYSHLSFDLSLCLSIQFRALYRNKGLERYAEMDREVWIAMSLLSVAGVCVGFAVNWSDKFSYQRHLQFLRLEFDTRLGMHSPR